MPHPQKRSRIEVLALRLMPSCSLPQKLTAAQALQGMWEDDCEWARRARRNFDAATDDASVRRDSARVWWYVIEAILREYGSYNSPLQPFHFPPELISAFCEMAGYLATGKIPDIISSVAGRGIPARGPRECEQIEIANCYVYWARKGTIADKHPIRTIAEAYHVDRRTARRWANEIIFRYEVSYPGDPQILIPLMRRSASDYVQTGRSIEAIRGRDDRK